MTIYFVNEGLHKSNSGIEHAEFDRARLFRRHGVDFKILTTVYLPQLHETLPMFNLKDKESLNMFDYFQNATNIKSNPMKPEDVDFGADVMLEKVDGVYHATVNGFFLGRIVVNPRDEVTRVELFDLRGNLYRVDGYDTRGFVSLRQYYSPDNKIEVEVWLDVDGKPAVEKTYTTVGDKTLEAWTVDGHTFDDIQDVRLYFYNQINRVGYNMFMIDRANVSQWQLLELDRPAYLAFMLHNHQSSDPNNPNAEILNDNYEFMLANMGKWDCVVSATPQQTTDVKNRWGEVTKYYTVPVGVISEVVLQEPRIKIADRKHHAMLVTARIASEKGIDKMIRALAIARKTIPDLTLDAYGYIDHSNNDAAKNSIQKALDELDDKDAFTLHGHTTDVASLHAQYPVYLIYSTMEGFNLALMEALSKGAVGLSNAVNYGPPELIKDGENGYVVAYDDVTAYANKMVALFQDEDKLQELSNGAYALSNRYSEDSVWQSWLPVLKDYEDKMLEKDLK